MAVRLRLQLFVDDKQLCLTDMPEQIGFLLPVPGRRGWHQKEHGDGGSEHVHWQ